MIGDTYRRFVETKLPYASARIRDPKVWWLTNWNMITVQVALAGCRLNNSGQLTDDVLVHSSLLFVGSKFPLNHSPPPYFFSLFPCPFSCPSALPYTPLSIYRLLCLTYIVWRSAHVAGKSAWPNLKKVNFTFISMQKPASTSDVHS